MAFQRNFRVTLTTDLSEIFKPFFTTEWKSGQINGQQWIFRYKSYEKLFEIIKTVFSLSKTIENVYK